MSERGHGSAQAATELVRGLFAMPPVNEAELKARLQGISRDDVRRALVTHLERDGVPSGLETVFLSAMFIVKPGGMRDRLAAIVLDRSRTAEARALANAALIKGDRAAALRVEELLSEDDLAAMAAVPMRIFARSILSGDDPGAALVTTLRRHRAEEVPGVIFELDTERKRLGVDAAALFGRALLERVLEPHPSLVEILAAERSVEALRLLESLRDSARDDAERARLQEALLRAGTAAVAPGPRAKQEPEGRAWITSCDGLGAFSVVAHVRSGVSATLANVCIRAAADVRDGFLERDATLGMALEVVDAMSEVTRSIELPLPAAASLVGAGARRTKDAGLAIPSDARGSVKLFEKVTPEELPPWPVEAGSLPSLEEMLELLEAPHRAPWFLDAGDVSAARLPDLPARPSRRSLDRWVEAASAAVDSPGLRARVIEIARHEARVLAWSGEPREASRFVAIGMDSERHGTGGILGRAMLIVGMLQAGLPTGDADHVIGDPAVRRALRGEFFGSIRKPTGRDLAALDFTEALIPALEEAVMDLPGEKRPRSGDILVTAHRLALVLARAAENGAESLQSEPTIEAAFDVIRGAFGLTVPEAMPMSRQLVRDSAAFLRDACSRCRVQCLATPAARMDAAFFADAHPSGP